MVAMGNPNPEKVMAGMMKKNAVTIACCCVDETVEMSRPTPSMQMRKRTAPAASTRDVAAKRHLEPQRSHHRNQRDIEEADQGRTAASCRG
jgi:hypothetical protein